MEILPMLWGGGMAVAALGMSAWLLARPQWKTLRLAVYALALCSGAAVAEPPEKMPATWIGIEQAVLVRAAWTALLGALIYAVMLAADADDLETPPTLRRVLFLAWRGGARLIRAGFAGAIATTLLIEHLHIAPVAGVVCGMLISSGGGMVLLQSLRATVARALPRLLGGAPGAGDDA